MSVRWAPVFVGAALYAGLAAAAQTAPAGEHGIDMPTLDRRSAPYRGWHYYPEHVIGSRPQSPGHEEFHSTDVPTVYQLPGDELTMRWADAVAWLRH